MMRKRLPPKRLVPLFFIFTAVFLVLAIKDVFGSKPALVYQAPSERQSLAKTVSAYRAPEGYRGLFLTAGAYLVADLADGGTVIHKNEETVFPIASITKLITALVAKDLLPADEEIIVSQQAWETYGNNAQLKVGQTFPLSVALYPLLLSSSNDLAEAIAETAGRDLFIAEMNKFVFRLGMTKTHFVDPSGLSPGNTSTASDLMKLAVYLHQQEAEILTLTRQTQYTYQGQTWRNVNDASRLDNYFGGKNGYTEEANRTLLSLFQVPITDASNTLLTEAQEKPARLLVVVLLQSAGQRKDTVNLIRYLSDYVYYLGARNGFVPSASRALPYG